LEIFEIDLRYNKRFKKTSVWIVLSIILPVYAGFAAGGISITELMYHALDGDGIADAELEFIEIKNISEAPVDFSGPANTGYSFPTLKRLRHAIQA
jgi:hypothetical protein